MPKRKKSINSIQYYLRSSQQRFRWHAEMKSGENLSSVKPLVKRTTKRHYSGFSNQEVLQKIQV